jgi:hypothetical protein
MGTNCKLETEQQQLKDKPTVQLAERDAQLATQFAERDTREAQLATQRAERVRELEAQRVKEAEAQRAKELAAQRTAMLEQRKAEHEQRA